MSVCKSRDLSLMSNAEHLIGFGQLLELEANRFADTSADPRINFVEYNSTREFCSSRYSLQNKHKTRRFASRRNPCQRTNIFSHIRGEIEFDLIYTVLCKAFRMVRILELRLRRSAHLKLKPCVFH